MDGEMVETVADFILGGSKITADGDCNHEIKRHLLLARKVMTNLDNILKSKDIGLPTKVHLVNAMVFFSSRVWMWELDWKGSWVLKKWWFWTVVLEKTLESLLGSKEIQSVHRKGGQSWSSLEGLMFMLKLQNFGHLMRRGDPFEKILMLGKIEGRQKGTTVDEMVGWYHWLNGREFGWTLGVGDGQRGLVCWSPWGRKESNTTEWLTWT